MSALDTQLHELFLWNYSQLPREKMLEDFIAYHGTIYLMSLKDLRGSTFLLGPADPSIGSNSEPVMPEVVRQACDELATLRGVASDDIANSLYYGPGASASDTPPSNYLDLLKAYTDLYNGTRIGQWLN